MNTMRRFIPAGTIIRHHAAKTTSTWMGTYDFDHNVIRSNDTAYKSPSGFASAHLKAVRPDRSSAADGWLECEYLCGTEWKCLNNLRPQSEPQPLPETVPQPAPLPLPEPGTLLAAISPAPSNKWNLFTDAATSEVSGSFGVNFDCRVSLRDSTPQEMCSSVVAAHPTYTPQQLATSRDQLVGIYAACERNNVIVFKKGKSPYALVRIVSDYRFEPDHVSGCPHRWDYEVIAMNTDPVRHNGWMKTYHPRAIAMPAL
jgi:hypothetical protein